MLIFHTFPAHPVQSGLPHTQLKAVAGLKGVQEPLSLLMFHVEDFAAFGAGQMDVIPAGSVPAELVERLVTSRLCDPLDFLLGLKLCDIAVNRTFADVPARQSLSYFFSRKGFVGIFGKEREKCRALFRVVGHLNSSRKILFTI